MKRLKSTSYPIACLKEKNVQPVEGANCSLSDATLRNNIQLLTVTIWLPNLSWTLIERSKWGSTGKGKQNYLIYLT